MSCHAQCLVVKPSDTTAFLGAFCKRGGEQIIPLAALPRATGVGCIQRTLHTRKAWKVITFCEQVFVFTAYLYSATRVSAGHIVIYGAELMTPCSSPPCESPPALSSARDVARCEHLLGDPPPTSGAARAPCSGTGTASTTAYTAAATVVRSWSESFIYFRPTFYVGYY